jgi:hypothetical protein
MNYIYRFPEKGQLFKWYRDDGLVECVASIRTNSQGTKASIQATVVSRYGEARRLCQSKIEEAWAQFPGGYDGLRKELSTIKRLDMIIGSASGSITLQNSPVWVAKKMSDFLVPSLFEIWQLQCAGNLETRTL